MLMTWSGTKTLECNYVMLYHAITCLNSLKSGHFKIHSTGTATVVQYSTTSELEPGVMIHRHNPNNVEHKQKRGILCQPELQLT